MKSTLCFPETSLQSNPVNSPSDAVNSQSNIEYCIANAWVNLVGGDYNSSEGDDWLGICGDIDDGEIYREWFLWQDSEATQEWEAYDIITNYRIVGSSRAMLITKIDKIEDARTI